MSMLKALCGSCWLSNLDALAHPFFSLKAGPLENWPAAKLCGKITSGKFHQISRVTAPLYNSPWKTVGNAKSSLDTFPGLFVYADTMDVSKMIAELRQERDHLDEVIMGLERVALGQRRKRGRPPGVRNKKQTPLRNRTISDRPRRILKADPQLNTSHH
jgi:hypothetical protein